MSQADDIIRCTRGWNLLDLNLNYLVKPELFRLLLIELINVLRGTRQLGVRACSLRCKNRVLPSNIILYPILISYGGRTGTQFIGGGSWTADALTCISNCCHLIFTALLVHLARSYTSRTTICDYSNRLNSHWILQQRDRPSYATPLLLNIKHGFFYFGETLSLCWWFDDSTTTANLIFFFDNPWGATALSIDASNICFILNFNSCNWREISSPHWNCVVCGKLGRLWNSFETGSRLLLWFH